MIQLSRLSTLGALGLILLTGTGCAHHGHPHGKFPGTMPETISVSGDGEARARPDRVHLTLGVEAKNENLDAAFAEASMRINALHDTLLKLGIREQDLKTGQFSIGTYREPVVVHVPASAPAPVEKSEKMAKGKVAATSVALPPPPTMVTEERWVERYSVSTNYEVTFDDVKKTGEVIKAAVQAGANQSWGVQFELANPKPLEDQARTAAIADAKRRAELLAREAGVELGRVLSIQEGSSAPQPMPMHRASFAMMKGAPEVAPMSVEAGENVLHSNVSIIYEIRTPKKAD